MLINTTVPQCTDSLFVFTIVVFTQCGRINVESIMERTGKIIVCYIRFVIFYYTGKYEFPLHSHGQYCSFFFNAINSFNCNGIYMCKRVIRRKFELYIEFTITIKKTRHGGGRKEFYYLYTCNGKSPYLFLFYRHQHPRGFNIYIHTSSSRTVITVQITSPVRAITIIRVVYYITRFFASFFFIFRKKIIIYLMREHARLRDVCSGRYGTIFFIFITVHAPLS